MPGWYVHLDAARKAVEGLADPKSTAAPLFQQGGKSAADLQQIAMDPNNQAYFALGAIGPDLFFLLPDFKPSMGQFVYKLANFIRDFYMQWDQTFWGPWTSAMDPVVASASNQLNGLTGGLLGQLGTIASEASSFLLDELALFAAQNIDFFSILGCGVIAGYDEKTFFWSDMLHYRRTYQFAADLWALADDVEHNRFVPRDEGKTAIAPDFAGRLRAYALGWMTHLATDVAGHCFVNEKCGGPFRLHWQRHHLIENHIDGKNYDDKYGAQSTYQMLGASMMHLWIAFDDAGNGRSKDEDGNPVAILFDDSKRPNYPNGDSTSDELARHKLIDVDSTMPDQLASFILAGLHKTYDSPGPNAATSAEAAHPLILNQTAGGADHAQGFPSLGDITGTYWWLYHYVKYTSTDFWKLRRPDPPAIDIPQPPALPYSGTEDDIIPDDAKLPETLENLFFAILAFLLYGIEWITYVLTFIPQLIASAGTLPLREVLYELIELPLYNLWMAMHWLLAMMGYVQPMSTEVAEGFVKLGTGFGDEWSLIWAELQVASGQVNGNPAPATEPSGHDLNHDYPRDTVEDQPGIIERLIADMPSPINALASHCSQDPRGAPSEFTRPWQFPLKDNDGTTVPDELPLTVASPFTSGQDATVLTSAIAGDNSARSAFENAANEADTISKGLQLIAQQKHLGSPVDYSAYVIAKLTRTNPDNIVNFNLDADRGYAHLCWDWKRDAHARAHPPMFGGSAMNDYRAPAAAGSGWCSGDLLPAPQGVTAPAIHTPSTPVRVRYIDKEAK